MSKPKQKPTSASTEPNGSQPESTQSKRLLLVEGDGFVRLVLLFLLKMAGFQVDFTSNGTLALRKLRSRHPDALLVELNLRGLSGLELIRAARRDLEFANRPIYVFTRTDLMNRSTRKEVEALATKVFDKRTVAVEKLAKTVAAMLTNPQGADASELEGATSAQANKELGEIPVPNEVQEIIEELRAQLNAFASGKDERARAAGSAELLSGKGH
jgi:CheY-like chemotaxis protein